MTYGEAIQDALAGEMRRDKRVFIYGPDVADHKRIWGTTKGLVEEFGKNRCFSTPIAEDALAGFGIGAALQGLRPIQVHIRADFALLSMNQIVNMAATMRYGSGGKLKVPFVVRAIIGRGWGQGFQHSKSLQSFYAHIPGLKVVMPTTAEDARGLLISSIRDENPVIFLEHRWLHFQKGEVSQGDEGEPLGKARILRKGRDITVIATSWMNVEAMQAAEILARHGIEVEVIDPRTLHPLDEEALVDSAKKTGHVIVADYDWAR